MSGENCTYKTLKAPVEGIIVKDRKSKFISYAYPIASEADSKTLLNTLRKKYGDANHICYAWQLGVSEVTYRVQDDGEPRNSAGMPIYGQIKSLGLTNVAVFVVRYFGGIKLGAGGLITAYREAARAALRNSAIAEKPVTLGVYLEFGYGQMSPVMRLLDITQAEIVNREMGVKAKLRLRVPLVNWQKFLKGLEPLRDIYFEETSS